MVSRITSSVKDCTYMELENTNKDCMDHNVQSSGSLSEWLLGSVAGEQHEILVTQENEPRRFAENLYYLPHRRLLVDWLSEVGELYSLQQATIHTAVHHLDRVLSEFEVPMDKLQLVAISCILIAAKFEEVETHTITTKELSFCADYSCSCDSILQTELEILDQIDWKVTAITPVTFAGYYLPASLTEYSDLVSGKPLTNAKKMQKYMTQYTEFFLDMCLQDYSFNQYKASTLALACIVAARRALYIEPLYSPTLYEISGQSPGSVQPVFEHVWRSYIRDFPQSEEMKTENSPKSVVYAEL